MFERDALERLQLLVRGELVLEADLGVRGGHTRELLGRAETSGESREAW